MLLLTWFSWRAVNPEAELFDHALAELNQFGMIENALSRDVFTARTGMLRNYDPLVHEVNALRKSLQRLSDICDFDPETTAGIARLASSVDNQEDLVEHFKTNNALMHNSLSFFGRFGVQAFFVGAGFGDQRRGGGHSESHARYLVGHGAGRRGPIDRAWTGRLAKTGLAIPSRPCWRTGGYSTRFSHRWTTH